MAKPAKRSGICKKCGAVIRPRAKDMSIGAASRKHYWSKHRDHMMAGVAVRQWNAAQAKKKAARATNPVPKRRARA